MKYLYLTLMVSLHTALTVTAQKMSFQSAVGMGHFSGYQHDALGFIYEPRFNFYEFSEKSSLSLSVCWAMGPSINDDYRMPKPDKPRFRILSMPWMYDAPVTINYTFGNAATPNSRKYVGYSAGIGYAAHQARRITNPEPGLDSLKLRTNGLVLDGRINFPVGNSSWSLRSTYMFNFSQYSPDVKGIFSMSLLYNIGVPIHAPREPKHFKHSKQYYRDLGQEARKRKWEQYQERRNKKRGIPAE